MKKVILVGIYNGHSSAMTKNGKEIITLNVQIEVHKKDAPPTYEMYPVKYFGRGTLPGTDAQGKIIYVDGELDTFSGMRADGSAYSIMSISTFNFKFLEERTMKKFVEANTEDDIPENF